MKLAKKPRTNKPAWQRFLEGTKKADKADQKRLQRGDRQDRSVAGKPTCVAGCGYPVALEGDACGECTCEDDCAP